MLSKLEELARSHNGPLTSELVRQPGKFGLGQTPVRHLPDATSDSICGFCSTGCSLKVHLKDGEAVSLTPNVDYPVNQGMACPKGWEALTPLGAEDRATQPLLRSSGGESQTIRWEQAATVFCEKIKSVQSKYGKESVAFLSTGQICTEEMGLLGAFAKFGMGMVHGDGNTRQCMATAVSAYKESFGFDAPPYTYQDFEESDVLVLIGSNLCVAHPIMWQRILQNKHSPKIIVIDPRKTETAMQATHHLPLRPKSDLVLLYGIANQLIERGYLDQGFIDKYTSGFDEFEAFLDSYSPKLTVSHSGISPDALNEVVDVIGQGKRVSFWWTMGVNQGHEATRTAQAVINLALMTGNIGRPGTGANSITGQCNAMGSRLFSHTSCLPGGRNFSSEKDRNLVAEVMDISPESIQSESGWAYDQIIDGIADGKIKALWVIATNGAHSWIDKSRFRKILEKLDFLVVQDMYSTTATAAMADLVLPAAGWGEKEGTFINSERRIGLVKKVKLAPGEALSDFSIFRLLAKAWGECEWLDEWDTPEKTFQILKETTVGMPCDISGIDGYDEIGLLQGIQWPKPQAGEVASERRLFEDCKFYTSDQRARFVWAEPVAAPEAPDNDFPYILITGRGSSGQWHTETRTAKSAILKKLNPNSEVIEINPVDAENLLIDSGDLVTVSSRRGSGAIRCLVTRNVAPGQVFMTMHSDVTNRLTLGHFDSQSRQPSYKYSTVRIERTDL